MYYHSDEDDLGENGFDLIRVKTKAHELTEELNKDEPIAHSTVQTLLRQLEAKGAVEHKKEQRTFYFSPVVKQENVKKSAARELIRNVFEGSAGGLVSYMLENENVSSKELAEIRKLLDQKKKK